MKMLLLFILVCSSAAAQMVPIDLPERRTSTTSIAAATIQAELLIGVRNGIAGRWSEGGLYPGTIREYDESQIEAVARLGITSRTEVGLRLGLSISNWFFCDKSAPDQGICPAVAHSGSGATITAVAKTRLYDGDGLVPAIAVGTSAGFAELNEFPGIADTMTMRLGTTVALSSRIGESGELGYGIGLKGINFADDNAATFGHYWIGALLPISTSILAGPEVSGDFPIGSDATPTTPSLRQWFGATVRIAPESWPLFHLDGRVSSGYDESLDYEIRLGAALASFQM